MDTEVLIAGAAPTGLMLANQLARRGVRPLLIDRHSGPAQQTRAMAVQARTLEIYSALGIIDQALALGKRAMGANLWASGRRTARIPLGEIGENLSPFPYVLMLGQDDNERIMGDRLRDWDVAVEWNTELVGLAQHADHVVATLKQSDGSTRTVKARWLAGCDGARSPVRDFCGITFPGAPYEHVFFVADTVATGDMVPGELNVYLRAAGFHLFFPMRGKDGWRVIGILPPALRERDDVKFDEVIPSLREEAGDRLTFSACHWFSTYRIHHRCASSFRDRRCFLLGDAAHVHSPMGAQGMNTGLQDAYNLGWKLALVVKGGADDALLETYAAERMPVAHRLLETTDRAFMLVVQDNWIAGLFRTRILARVAALAMRGAAVRRLAFRTISQIGISYRESRLSQTLAGVADDAPRAGDRMPWLRLVLRESGPAEDLYARLDDTRFNLILIGQAAAPKPSDGDPVKVHPIAADQSNDAELQRAAIKSPAFYLVRPDGFIALAGGQFDTEALTRYFAAQQIRLRPALVSEARAAA